MPYHHDAFSTGGNNGEFYHFTLGKLAGSAAHLDPKKKGRAMCEAFGAYGWNEGLKMMKWLTDHLITRGINTLVPHAFDPKEFPDWDCPPHFYAQGNNPQFRYFKIFTDYANRLLNLFHDGRTAARTGVLYNGMLEWAGSCMPLEKIMRELTEHQIDADIISEDYLDNAEVSDKRLIINGTAFEVLFVPEAERIPGMLEEKLARLIDSGMKVIFIGKDVELAEAADACEDIREVHLDAPFQELVYYHYKKEKQDILMFFNESITESVDTAVTLSFPFPAEDGRKLYRYDAFQDEYFETGFQDGRIRLRLAPYESAVFLLQEELSHAGRELEENWQSAGYISDNWELSFASAREYPVFKEIPAEGELKPVSSIPGYEEKTGTALYETAFEIPKGFGRYVLDLGEVYETAEVFVNERPAGVRICPPYRFDITRLLQQGENHLRVEVTNTIGASVRDGLSQYLVIEPFGMMSAPEINVSE